MDVIVQCGEFMANAFVAMWSAIGTWGVIGVGIIGTQVFYRIGNLLKKIFQF